MTDRILLLLGLLIACLLPSEDMYAQWKYIQIDSTKQKWGDWAEPNWLRYFGLDAGDVDRDGCIDIVSGRYLYRNPCADMEAHWERQSLDDNVDAILMINIDDDPYADIIAQALPDLYWFEAIDQEASAFTRRKIATVPATSHVNSQGFVKGDLDSDEREEIVIAGNGNIYAIKIPNDPHTQDWPTSLICANTSDEGIGIGDINGDGHLDIAAGRRPEGEGEPTILTWFRNPGNLTAVWVDQVVGGTDHPIDRIKIGDINGDKKPDIIVTEERYPGLEPDAHLYWFAQPNGEGPWERHTIVQQYSMNNLDATDMDRDGDLDVLTNEHKGTKLALQWWINDGQGTFIKRTIDTGKENHLGTQLVDLDRDGDLDIIGAGWDQYRFMHVWRNDKNTTQVLPKTKTTSGFGIGPIRQTMYEGRPHYLIKTATLTYYYDINGGGLSRIIDPKGNDWIGYRTTPSEDYPAAAAGAFRGVPNAVFQSDDGGAGHPGFDQCTSFVTAPNAIVSKSNSGKWQWQWTFHADHARCEFQKVAPDHPYWFLYEGTPGGSFEPEHWYFGTDQFSPIPQQPDYYSGTPLRDHFRWIYFGNTTSDGVLYFAQEQADHQLDIVSYLGNDPALRLKSSDGMTVFGFGRGDEAQPLLTTPHEFIVGYFPHPIRDPMDHQFFKEFIDRKLK